MSKNFQDISIKITKSIEKQEKKDDGIFFTPQTCVRDCIKFIEPYFKNNNIDILEPSCGSGEFIHGIINSEIKYNYMKCIEYNSTIYNSISKSEISCHKNLMIEHNDFLLSDNSRSYDLIIGNPPFYVMKKQDCPREYDDYYTGRPNIFIIFILQSLKMLANNGILCFVLPKNFLNCVYYEKTRRYISENYKIISIDDRTNKDTFLDTQQETIVMIVRKNDFDEKTKKENEEFCINISENIVFNTKENITKLNSIIHGSTTLSKLGYNVNVGTVVWNQHKDILTNNTTDTRLIYNSDIEDGKIIVKKYKNPDKKNFIQKSGMTGPKILMNRGYGKGKYTFDYVILDPKEHSEYLIENHLIMIYKNYQENEYDKAKEEYENIAKSLEDNRLKEFIQIYFGNNAINTTEMKNILPIFI